MKDTSELLTLVRDLIETKGWVQGQGHVCGDDETVLCLTEATAKMGFCLTGAAAAVAYTHGTGYESFRMIQRSLKAALIRRGNISHITAWNDADHRTKDDVIELLNDAVSNLEVEA